MSGTPGVARPDSEELLALRASEWFELLPTATAAQLGELEAWLSGSKVHVQEFLEVAAVEFALGGIDRRRQHDVDRLLQRVSSNVVPLPSRSNSPASRKTAPWRHWQVMAMAASLAAIALLVTQRDWTSGGAPKQQFATNIGEHRTLRLEDQSTVALNADSQMEVTFGRTARDIELVQGEATFEATRDASRPFRVHTHAGTVTVLGTKFNVRNLANGGTRVSLLEGRVQLNSATQQMTLQAGQEVDIRADGSFEPHPDAVVADALAWQQNQLVFQNASLSEMVDAFNRQNNTTRLRIEGVDGDSHRLDASFNANDPEALAELLAREPDLEVAHEGQDIVIRAKRH